jgi:L-alanine-DL-glutamate epimerase-like enolase superfamily enzyme
MESLVDQAVAAKELGFRAVKLEVCIKGPYSHNAIRLEDDRAIAEVVRARRQAIGSEMTVMVDIAHRSPGRKAAVGDREVRGSRHLLRRDAAAER